jgi:hypothetical protein
MTAFLTDGPSMSNEWDDDYDSQDDSDVESETVECSNCGHDVYEDAVQCPICNEYITQGQSAWEGKPAWWAILGLLGIVAVIFALSGL